MAPFQNGPIVRQPDYSAMTTFPEEYLTTVFLLDSSRPVQLPMKFAIITAWNPRHRSTTEAENHREDEALRRTLELMCLPYFRATGCSPDYSHREPGWAIETTKVEAIELGRRYGQRAIWWIEGGELILVSCEDGGEQALGSFDLRVQAE